MTLPKANKLAPAMLSVLALCAAARLFGAGDVRVTVDRNLDSAATPRFQFHYVPSPVKENAATHARLFLLDGERDPEGAALSALTDGALPLDQDDPANNFFFNEATGGGRFAMDLGRPVEIAQVNSYSWHYGDRGPQLYRLYASDGATADFNPEPRGTSDPTKAGWKFIALVDTRSQDGDDGGQYGVSISSATGSLGRFRYLLFDCYAAELADAYGNTFYSEINVIEKK